MCQTIMEVTLGGLLLLFAAYIQADKFINVVNQNYKRSVELPSVSLPIFTPEPVDVPEAFDAREKWKTCSDVFNSIRDEGVCAADAVLAISYMISTRICIESKGTIKVNVSGEDGLTCCPKELCGYHLCKYGNNPAGYLKFWVNKGLVTGGERRSYHGCKPYSWDAFYNEKINDCVLICTNVFYRGTYNDDKIYGKEAYLVNSDSMIHLQREIFTRGPIVTEITVLLSFLNYTGGVYSDTSSVRFRMQVVLIGWRVEPDGKQYWLGVSSYGKEWGMKRFFQILKGQKAGGIEKGLFFGGRTKYATDDTSSMQFGLRSYFLTMCVLLASFSI